MTLGAMGEVNYSWLLAILLAILGLIFGSFASALIDRVPTGETLLTRSRCPHCRNVITAAQNIPLLSYVIQRGKCKSCGIKISKIYPLIEISMMVLFITPLFVSFDAMRLILWVTFSVFALPLLVIDLNYHRLPDRLTIPLLLLIFLEVLGQAILTGNYHRLVPAFYGMLGLLCFYLALMFISRGGMGMGDVKLSSAIGGITGFLGLKYVFIASFSAFFMGAIIGISLMALGKAGRKTAIPFGPFMLVGVFMALLASTI